MAPKHSTIISLALREKRFCTVSFFKILKEKTMPKVFWLNAYVKGDKAEKAVILRHLDSQYPASNLKIERKI